MSDKPATADEVLDDLFTIGNMTDEQFRAVKKLRVEVKRWRTRYIDAAAGWQQEQDENERLRMIERAARAAVETERALGFGQVRLTLLADVLEEFDGDKARVG